MVYRWTIGLCIVCTPILLRFFFLISYILYPRFLLLLSSCYVCCVGDPSLVVTTNNLAL